MSWMYFCVAMSLWGKRDVYCWRDETGWMSWAANPAGWHVVSRWKDVQLFVMHVLLNLRLSTTWPFFMLRAFFLFLTQTHFFFLCFSFSPSSHACAAPDVDECLTQQHNCSRGTTCVNTGGSFQCVNPECPHLHGNISYVKTSPLWVRVHNGCFNVVLTLMPS